MTHINIIKLRPPKTAYYREIIFEHPGLTKIISVPDYGNLHLLHKEIKDNSISVHSNVEGGKHVYLGLVVSPTSYVLISNTPFFRTVHTGTLVIPVAATLHDQDELKRQYKTNLHNFHETRGLEHALIQQIMLVIESRFITDMRKRTTGRFS